MSTRRLTFLPDVKIRNVRAVGIVLSKADYFLERVFDKNLYSGLCCC